MGACNTGVSEQQPAENEPIERAEKGILGSEACTAAVEGDIR
jgi:hypothetical protein